MENQTSPKTKKKLQLKTSHQHIVTPGLHVGTWVETSSRATKLSNNNIEE